MLKSISLAVPGPAASEKVNQVSLSNSNRHCWVELDGRVLRVYSQQLHRSPVTFDHSNNAADIVSDKTPSQIGTFILMGVSKVSDEKLSRLLRYCLVIVVVDEPSDHLSSWCRLSSMLMQRT